MQKFWSPLVDRLNPYVPGEQPKDQHYIKLNTNENPYPPSPKVLRAMQEGLNGTLRLYPDPEAVDLKDAIANDAGLQQNQVFVGNGSDEVLAFAFMAFYSEKSYIQFPEITYSFYPVYCNLFNIEARTVPLASDFSIDFEQYSHDAPGIIFPNPNAPTGRVTSLEDVEALLIGNSGSMVIVDEAYIDFGGVSAATLVDKYENLLVIQTFSKSRSLAGMRIGFALGCTDLIEALTRVKNSFNSYPLDRMAQIAGKLAIEDKVYFDSVREKVMLTRGKTVESLNGLGFNVIPSSTNFIFAKRPGYKGEFLLQRLREKGILVRHFNIPTIEDYLRISIGTDEEMDALIKGLTDITEE